MLPERTDVLVVGAGPTGLAVATFHTFPDEFAVLKTQSLIERA